MPILGIRKEGAKKIILVAITALIITAAAITIANYYTGTLGFGWRSPNILDDDEDGIVGSIDPNPKNPDADGDLLLDGHDITVRKGTPEYSRFMSLRILYNENYDGTITFLGELDTKTDPRVPDADLVQNLSKLPSSLRIPMRNSLLSDDGRISENEIEVSSLLDKYSDDVMEKIVRQGFNDKALKEDIDQDHLDLLSELQLGTNPLSPNPVIKYAIDKGVSLSALKPLIRLDEVDASLDPNDRYLITELSPLPESVQKANLTLSTLDSITDDGIVTDTELRKFRDLDEDGIHNLDELKYYESNPIVEEPFLKYIIDKGITIEAIKSLSKVYASTVDEKNKGLADELALLPAEVQKHDLVMGKLPIYAEDGKITQNEVNDFKDLDQDLVSNYNELYVLETDPVTKDIFYVVDDVFQLPEVQDGIDQKELEAIKEILGLERSDDPEVLKGLQLIDQYGIPSRGGKYAPTYKIPKYNTQAEVLFWLALDKDIDEDYDRFAIALGVDYGIVVTYGDDDVDRKVRGYVSDVYDYVKGTDGFLQEKGIGWQAKNYPLEADMMLAWGACELRYPTFYGYVGQDPGTPWTHFWYNEFRGRQMNIEDFNWLFVSPEILKEMKNWLDENDFIVNDINEITDKVDNYAGKHLHYYTDRPDVPPSYVEVEGKLTPGCRISNPDWQWNRLIEKGEFIGNCEDVAHMDEMLLKSLNIAGGTASESAEGFGHASILYYNPQNNVLKTTPRQLDIINRHARGDITYRYYKIGWDNLHYQRTEVFVAKTPDKNLLGDGISREYVTKSG